MMNRDRSCALKCQRVHAASPARHSGDPTNISTNQLQALVSPSAALEELRKARSPPAHSPWPTRSVVSIPMTTEHGVFCIEITLCTAPFRLVRGCFLPLQATTEHTRPHPAGLGRPA